MSVLGNRIRRLRKKANLTQAELGKLLDCSNSTISLYEGGQRSPDTMMLVRLADVFDVSVDYLLGREHSPDPKEEVHTSPPSPDSSMLLMEGLTPEGAQFLAAMTREVKKFFSKRPCQTYSRGHCSKCNEDSDS